MQPKRFIMNAGRTTKQGQQINAGKDSSEYQRIVSTVTMHPDDMKAAGLTPGGNVRIRTEHADVIFTCVEGKVPPGMIFVPYGPPTCRLMGRFTDGTGMPTSKGWEVEVEAVA
ncbi:MAG TPA: molybdopterin dinucleotide binding domain-containing protein [Vicinamibacterales bacterium]|nr:molybdopterin dinucleotide binding domain-containing protein [Vicinamibacterales bacterium]